MNNQIIEDYCSFEVSKLLKEKGFWTSDDEVIRRGWVLAANNTWSFTSFGTEERDNYNDWVLVRRSIGGYVLPENIKNICLAPTHALAKKWIRENFGIIISINPFINGLQMDDDIPEDEPVGTMWSYYIHKNRKFVKDEVDFSSPDQATEAALLHTLQTFIQ